MKPVIVSLFDTAICGVFQSAIWECTLKELKENLSVINSPRMNDQDRDHWERYGDIVYSREGAKDAYESRWP